MANIETTHWKFVVVSEPVELTKEEELPHMKHMQIVSRYIANSIFLILLKLSPQIVLKQARCLKVALRYYFKCALVL